MLWGSDYKHNAERVSGDEGTAWWSARHAQSRVGVLVQVQAQVQGDGLQERGVETYRGRPRITELLIYGFVTDGQGRSAGLTPPAEEAAGFGVREMRVRALPLSSDLLYRGQGNGESQCGDMPLSPASDGSGSRSPTAYFLPPFFAEAHETSTSARKRQRVVNLLDDAALRHKKARRKGGDAVGKVMESIDGRSLLNQERPPSQSSVTRTVTKIEKEDGQSLFKEDSQYRRSSLLHRRSRSSSVSSFQNTVPARPPSRRGLLVESKRSSLHRVDSIVTANDGSPVPEQEKSIEQRNKDALSRIIMAGMRLYGLQQKRKAVKSRAASEVPSQSATPDIVPEGSAEEVDEYKLIYHQTLKGAVLALRRDIARTLLPQAVMREVADKLLAIFCSDPLSEPSGFSVQGFGRDDGGMTITSQRPVVEPG